MKFINTIEKHANEPEKTVDAYIKEKKLELGEWVNLCEPACKNDPPLGQIGVQN